MSINFSQKTSPQATPGNLPENLKTLADPKKTRKLIKDFKKQQKEVTDIKTNIEQSVNNINQKLDETFGKSAKFVCLLRLDMVADKLEKTNPKLASQVDDISNKLEKSNWE